MIIVFLLAGFTQSFSKNAGNEILAAKKSVKLGDDIMLGLTDSNNYKNIKFFGFRAPGELAGSLGSVLKIKDKGEKGTQICIYLQNSGKKVWVTIRTQNHAGAGRPR